MRRRTIAHSARAISIMVSLWGMIAAAAATPTTLSSRITEVTVYTDRAEVTRVAKLSLGAGDHMVSFVDLPPNIDRNSIQVSGGGNAILQDVRFEQRQLKEPQHSKGQQLATQLVELRDSLTAVENAISHARREIEFVERIAEGLTRNESKETPVELDPAKWRQMVAFYRTKLDELDTQILAATRHSRELSREIDRVNREQRELAANQRKVSNDVEVSLHMRSGGTVLLELSYVVFGPSWTPLYDIRVSSDNKALALTYKAQVRQSTSEEWENVRVKLSTADPRRGGQHPELQPWRLSFQQPVFRPGAMAKRKSAPRMSQMMNTMPVMEEAEMADEERVPMTVATAQVETGATAVVFVPEGTTTIGNDNQPSTVVVTQLQLPAHFRYSTVPKLSPHAYLKAKATNDSDYPLLPGRVNVFFDNAFVTSSTMELVAPTEEFWTFLGIDAAFDIEHKLVKRFEEKIGRDTKVTWEYRMEVVNNKKSAAEIVLWDQLPLTGNEQIEVECLEPKYREPTEALKKNQYGYLEWYFELQPGESTTIPLRFSVRYPEGKAIQGL